MLQLAITLRHYQRPESHVGSPIVAVGSGPIFSPELVKSDPELVKRLAHNFTDMVLLDLFARANSDSLPEKGEQQPHYLNVARQWLALVESGKQGARCIAVELPTGERQITITLHEPHNGKA